ncbi:MAG TPA: DUF2079 domain-containing protein [Firmicutes bacterium]|nr:DUF2079 domain-containing protein [Bacillota bacterium]
MHPMDQLGTYSNQFNASAWMIALRLAVIAFVAWRLAGPIESFFWKRQLPEKANRTGIVIFIAILAFLVLFSAGALRHLTFHSKAWDLAIFDQVVWNLANGNGWECSVRGVIDLRGDHFSPILLIFVPFYKIAPHVFWLLGFQAAALIGAGLILWAVYRKEIGERVALMFFIAYCLFPPIHWLACADFHPIAIAPFFVAIAWWGRKRDNITAFIAGIIGMTLCGEEAFIVAGWWGLWEFFERSPWRRIKSEKTMTRRNVGWVGLFIMAFCWTIFIWLSLVYIPAHRAEGEGYFYVHRYAYLGDSVGEIALNFFVKPGLWLSHVFDMRSFALLALYIVPLGFLPLTRLGISALLIPTALYTLISVSPEQKSIYHQYTAMWIPFLAIATVDSLHTMRYAGVSVPKSVMDDFTVLSLRRASMLVVAAVLGFLAFSPIFGLSGHPEWFTPEEWAGEAKGVVESVPPDAAISAPSALCPHLSHRPVLLLKPETEWQGAYEVLVLPDFPPE